MTTAQAMAIIWVITMIILGLIWTRMKHWKERHDFDHGLAERLHTMLQTMEPTEQTWKVIDQMNEQDKNMKIMLVRGPEQ